MRREKLFLIMKSDSLLQRLKPKISNEFNNYRPMQVWIGLCHYALQSEVVFYEHGRRKMPGSQDKETYFLFQLSTAELAVKRKGLSTREKEM